MVPAQARVDFQVAVVVVIIVSANHLRGVQTVHAASETRSSTATRETHIVGVVGITHQHETIL